MKKNSFWEVTRPLAPVLLWRCLPTMDDTYCVLKVCSLPINVHFLFLPLLSSSVTERPGGKGPSISENTNFLN